MPIKCYGLHWSADFAMVGIGQAVRVTPQVDLSKQLGIYVLYDGDVVRYVGKSARGDKAGIAGRLYCHWHKKGWRWSSHSWFGFRHVGLDGLMKPYDRTERSEAGTISDIEALLINVSGPTWNGNRGAYSHMEEFTQLR